MATKWRVDVEDGFAWATWTTPIVWFESFESDHSLDFAGLASLDDYLVFATAGGAYGTYSDLGRTVTLPPLEANGSEVRTWETATGQQLGVCLPERHQVSIGETAVSQRFGVTSITWPFASEPGSETVLGTSVGQDGGQFVFPLSFDRSPDGRFYVLDAGNGRIQSFDEDGAYITQWGGSGSGDAEFNFGTGREATDFAGSVIADDDGFIYVADVGNKRIQKFHHEARPTATPPAAFKGIGGD